VSYKNIISIFVGALLLVGCPAKEKCDLPPRLGERPVVAIVKRPSLEDVTKGGEIPNANDIGAIVDNSVKSPDLDCIDCGLEKPDVFQAGNFSERFQAVKKVTNYIMDNKQVQGLEELSFSDKADFCPRYEDLKPEQKRDFWSTLLAVMSIYESGIRPGTSYDEGQTDANLDGVVSRGLVQMSYNSAKQKRYVDNGCQLESARQLHIPHVNLRCALAAMKTLVKQDGCIACGKKKGGAKYWSTLRNPYKVKNRKTGEWIDVGKKPKVLEDLKKYKPDCF
jgi:hypothetical protein